MSKFSEQAMDFLQQGVVLMQREKYEEAIGFCQKAIEAEPRYADAYSTMSDAYANLGQFEQALEIQKKVILLDPENGEAYFDLGNLYVLLNDFAKGVENYNKADEKGFKNILLYKNLAQIYREIGETDLALRNYNKAIETEPLRADIRLEKAGYYILLGKFQEAIETLENLQKLEPDLYDAYAMRAEIYCGLGQDEKALELIEKATADYPDDTALMVEKIKILIRMNDLAGAKKEIDTVKTMKNYEMVSRNVLLEVAQIASMEGNLEAAAAALLEIVEKSEEYDEEASFLLLNAYNGLGDLERGLPLARELAARGKDNLYTVTGMYYVPFILKKQGQTEEADREFRRLTSYLRRVTVKNPHFYEGYLYRLMCHRELGEYEKALELADYIEALNVNSSDAFALRYSIYTAMGDTEKAEEMKKKVAQINPDLKL